MPIPVDFDLTLLISPTQFGTLGRYHEAISKRTLGSPNIMIQSNYSGQEMQLPPKFNILKETTITNEKINWQIKTSHYHLGIRKDK